MLQLRESCKSWWQSAELVLGKVEVEKSNKAASEVGQKLNQVGAEVQLKQTLGQSSSAEVSWQSCDLVSREVELSKASHLLPAFRQLTDLIIAQVKTDQMTKLDHPLVHPGQSYP